MQVLQRLAKENRVVIYSEKMLQAASRIKVVDALVKPGAKP